MHGPFHPTEFLAFHMSPLGEMTKWYEIDKGVKQHLETLFETQAGFSALYIMFLVYN